MNQLPAVAVVILNWNGRDMLNRFLPSVLKSRYDNLRIILGDNASTDDSVDFVRSRFPEVEILENRLNYGYAGGYNALLERVEADYFVLLNSDVEVPENWIAPVVAAMEADDTVAAAQPKIKAYKDRSRFEYAGAAGGFIDRFGYTFCRGRIFNVEETDHGQYDASGEVFWASGAAFFIKSKYWRATGGFDADLFAHMEEIDLCWRLKNRGLKVLYVAESQVFHVGGATLQKDNPFKTYLNFRNNLMIMQKNLPAASAGWLLFLRMWIDFAAWWQFLLTGKPKLTLAVSRAHWHFLRAMRKTAAKREKHAWPLLQHRGVYHGSIVWDFFLRGKKKFSALLKF
ncbi:glycosyl transferase family 2 [Pedobacter yulinensis]|uniref:Glycosyl transferase family 2 n=1 Tax=Pedobacter yulinensis TaxID=2126353 RepID=A0A2T3HKI0_9SPHI|nr:glycosyltransferase family 2 protein [Pedobacter yulinensis]PST82952.1 glycosyl transferase family 2 [Pedobacter yulinensis]